MLRKTIQRESDNTRFQRSSILFLDAFTQDKPWIVDEFGNAQWIDCEVQKLKRVSVYTKFNFFPGSLLGLEVEPL